MSVYWTPPQEITLPCIQDKYFKLELVSGDHSFGHILSGEVKVMIAGQTYILNAGDTWFCPRNQLATFIKYPKDGKPYKSVLISLRADRLKTYYTHHTFSPAPHRNYGIRHYGNHPLFESFFGSLCHILIWTAISFQPWFRLKLKRPSPFCEHWIPV